MKDPEQRQGLPSELPLEELRLELEALGDHPHHLMTHASLGRDEIQHCRSQLRQLGGKQIRSVHGPVSTHAWIFRAKLLTEVQALLQIRGARGELATEGKPAAPRPSTVRHRAALLGFQRQRKELRRGLLEPRLKARIDTVTRDVEEPVPLARDPHCLRIRSAQVNDR